MKTCIKKSQKKSLFKDSKNGWLARIANNEAIITYKKSEYPDACFAHELLHIKYELKDWTEQDSLDSSMAFARIFKVCNRSKIGFCLSGKEEDIIVARNI